MRLRQSTRRHAEVLLIAGAISISRFTLASAQNLSADQIRERIPVFQIHATKCPVGDDRVLTGFIDGDTHGMLTALHGVLGCNVIAFEPGTSVVVRDLQLKQVDVDRDVAWLSSTTLDDASRKHPSLVLKRGSIPAGQHVFVLGFPRGVQAAWVHELTIDSTTKKLGSGVVPPGPDWDALNKRCSPSLDLAVVTLSGPLQPGHSGAPVLSAQGSVIAIGNGGIIAADQMGWAFAISQLALTDVASQRERLKELRSAASNGLFAYESTSLKPTATAASFSVAVSPNSPKTEFAARLTFPFWLGNHRVAVSGTFGNVIRESRLPFDTLPGLPQSTPGETVQNSYVDIGFSYFPRKLPHGNFDPYLRFDSGVERAPFVDQTRYGLRLGGTAGLDLLIARRLMGFVEFTTRREEVHEGVTIFNKYGAASAVTSASWSTAYRLTAGVRISFPGWGHQ